MSPVIWNATKGATLQVSRELICQNTRNQFLPPHPNWCNRLVSAVRQNYLLIQFDLKISKGSKTTMIGEETNDGPSSVETSLAQTGSLNYPQKTIKSPPFAELIKIRTSCFTSSFKDPGKSFPWMTGDYVKYPKALFSPALTSSRVSLKSNYQSNEVHTEVKKGKTEKSPLILSIREPVSSPKAVLEEY